MNSTLPQHEIVLLGAGHTNCHVLRMWRMKPIANARLTCVSNFSWATYSGMLPGTLAGLYPPERMEIDLVRFCASAGVRLLKAEVAGLDVAGRRLLFDDRPPLPFDALSIGIGSVPQLDHVAADDPTVLPIKPMQAFLARLDRRLAELRGAVVGRPLRLAVVGGGAGGVEIGFCLPFHLRKTWPDLAFELSLVNRQQEIPNGAAANAAAIAKRELQARGVRLVLGRSVVCAGQGELELDDGERLPVDLALWATSAAAPESLARLGLPTDEQGFLLTRPTLQTTADAPIFAVGDSGTCPDRPTPKAGVYAVRQGPILWQNLQRSLCGEPPVEYVPQRGFLSLLATGDRRAILSYKGFSAHAAWCWKLKDYIDGRFMDMYQDYAPMTQAVEAPLPARQMRCAGCGGKVAGSILSKALSRLEIPASQHVLLGLEAADDAAIVRPPGGRPIVATVDFFAAFLEDPYLVGRVAALNSLSDVFALGAMPLAAMAMATVPVGPERAQEQLLYELLAGGLREFRQAGATLIGGHTIEGPTTTIGFSLLADAGDDTPRLKSGLRRGDQLVLTKPLGSGILLAAQMQARLRARWMDELLPTLLASNQPAAEIARQFDVSGMTDVTGFGFAGHLLEMLRASNLAAEICLADVPLLAGVAELAAEGVESTLAPANRGVESEIENRRPAETHAAKTHAAGRLAAAYSALFDPQTSGGLLFGVRPEQVDSLLARLRDSSGVGASAVGEVVAYESERQRLRIV
jgi:selenide, water dikinase